MALIIVESPTKARTFNRILKAKNWQDKYYVFPTVGHFRDLPTDRVGIDYQHNFKPEYIILPKRQQMLENLKKLAEKHRQVILATDPDREGEAISYHAAFILGFIREEWPNFYLNDRENFQRIIFHEITTKALEDALNNPQSLRTNLVKAQQGRRILDRIVGYELSPLLWKKTGKNWLSAGRVQTVSLRLIVEREAEINKFKSKPYFQIFAEFKNSERIRARLISYKDQLYEQKAMLNLFAGKYEFTKTTITKDNVQSIKSDLSADNYHISNIKEDIIFRYPPPPYSTSLLQQDAFQKFGYPSKLTMRIAQSLYEKGLITYHRTDSFNLSSQFLYRVKDYIVQNFGSDYSLSSPRHYQTKSRLAQEAHEAIRPTKLDNTPSILKKGSKLSPQELKLYELIFNRTLSTQMKEAKIKQIKIDVLSKKYYRFQTDHVEVIFDGFMRLLWPDYSKKHHNQLKIKKDDSLTLVDVEALELTTKPPPRYTEASLIRILEDKGIGRPSTYAPIISLIQDKNYVVKEGRYFMPTELGTAICRYLVNNFNNLFDLEFTAQMEDDLDQIANGQKDVITVLSEFYQPFISQLNANKSSDEKIVINETVDEKCPKCGGKLTIKYSRYGKFFACSNYPSCKYIKQNLKYLENEKCPLDNGRLVIRYSKSHKRFYGCENYPQCRYTRWSKKANPDLIKNKKNLKSS